MTFLQLQKWRSHAVVATLYLASSAAGSLSCGNLSADGSAPPRLGSAGASGGDAGPDSGEVEAVPDSLTFEPASTLQLNPKATQELTVRASPAGSFRVRFALLGSDSAPRDAVLDSNEAETDHEGIAHVTLTAPSTPTTFSVRASVASKQTSREVTVSRLGYTTLQVQPSYSGHRQVTRWTATATAQAGLSCSKLVGNPPPDGDLAQSAAPGESLILPEVPIGVDLVVTLRAGHYIGGCANLLPLSEGDGNQVSVYASDRPLNLAVTQLDLKFGPNAQPELDQLLKNTVALAQSALSGTAASDDSALLDAMYEATPAANREAFSLARVQNNWDAALDAAFGKSAARRLRDPAQRWLSAGLSAFNAPDTFSGQLRASGSNAVFKLLSVAQTAPAGAGFPTSFAATWSADSSDTLLLGTELTWLPSRLVTALAVAPALAEYPAADSIESALALSVDCALVAQTLLTHGVNPGMALYTSCDAACAQSSCESALSNAWKKARNASGTASATLGITATGLAQVGDAAQITSLQGSWVGELSIEDSAAGVSGALSATSLAK